MKQIVNEEAGKALEKKRAFQNAETGLRSKTLEYFGSGKSDTVRKALTRIFKEYVELRKTLNGKIEMPSRPSIGFNEYGETLTELQTYDKEKGEVTYAMVLKKAGDAWLGISMSSTTKPEVVNISEDVGRITSIIDAIKTGSKPLKELKHIEPQVVGIAVVESREEEGSPYNWKEILHS
ncbi:MAG: hypothetical protein KGH61_05615 [Candidatus Micrarchaeota archaeon]|nr:hypothetical protein [Candidatus Micrarchaeota archaeon]MDE1848392.1 hypothetical protein [Candidatus Micrarchaeota archaeon]MDE1864446.1 hypothetical protein [Candidatus Micrarchaeota archaeon]